MADGGGLYLEVTPAGGKLWRYRFRLAGKENVFAIGAYPRVSLADARKARDEARDLVKQGFNPSHYRQQAKQAVIDENLNTFAPVADEWYQSKVDSWSKGHRHHVRTILDKDILPRIGKLPIRSITSPLLHDVMKKIVARGATTRAILARQIMGSVFNLAILTHRADTNPAEPLKRQIARCVTEHHRHLEERDVGDFLRKLSDYTGHATTRIALQLLMLTAVRPGEVCGARWAEFDIDGQNWTIPKERMKTRKPHIVPLSNQAVDLLKELEPITGDTAFLFPSQGTKTQTMPTQSIRNAVVKLGYADKFSPHGARGTFSTMLNGRGYNSDWIERQLAHDEGNRVRASYNHMQYLPERRKMLQEWADLLDELRTGAKVLPFQRSA
ncbi:tyrosine-type recombinase/integrase [Aromatoleum aromaticum]